VPAGRYKSQFHHNTQDEDFLMWCNLLERELMVMPAMTIGKDS
jgi:hypothetical protein